MYNCVQLHESTDPLADLSYPPAGPSDPLAKDDNGGLGVIGIEQPTRKEFQAN